ncbi:DUF1127 domain-containing protein [Thiofilum flexile]|uniref:DUF1127 domain-containing protein n=1 Tax=Thiofilum flexile TaxID=125627 RepID=UPI00035DEC9B|nr:DUF1127 domain-containing protein [Thiofilum flexile]
MSNIINLISTWFKPQAKTTNTTALSEREIRRAVTELKALDDRDLSELGLTRGGIEYAVRYGRPQDQWNQAA